MAKDEKKKATESAADNTRKKGSKAAEDARQAKQSPDIRDDETLSLRPVEGEEVPDVTAEDRAKPQTEKDGLATHDEISGKEGQGAGTNQDNSVEGDESDDGEDSDLVASSKLSKLAKADKSNASKQSDGEQNADDKDTPETAPPRVEPGQNTKEVKRTNVNAIDKVLALVIDELQKRFDDRVPVDVLKFLIPHITSLVGADKLDARARLQMQARIDDALRRLGMI